MEKMRGRIATAVLVSAIGCGFATSANAQVYPPATVATPTPIVTVPVTAPAPVTTAATITPQVLGATITSTPSVAAPTGPTAPPSVVDPAAPAIAPQVLGATIAKSRPLAFTGTNVLQILGAATALIWAGALFLGVSRRRRSS